MQSSEASAGEGMVGSCCAVVVMDLLDQVHPWKFLVLSVTGLDYIRN